MAAAQTPRESLVDPHADPRAEPHADPNAGLVIEAFDRPDLLISGGGGGGGGGGSDGNLTLEHAAHTPRDASAQRWHLRQLGGSARLCAVGARLVRLQSAGGGGYVRHLGSGLGLGPRGEEAGAAVFVLAPPLAEYPPLALWAHSNMSVVGRSAAGTGAVGDAGPVQIPVRRPPRAGERRSFLMVPMRELVDETYSSHLCVLPADAGPAPPFCGL